MKSLLYILTLAAALAAGPTLADDSPAAPTDTPTAAQAENAIAQHLQNISVTIVSRGQFGGGGEGSGVIKTRTLPTGESVNFVWTAAHVVDNLRHTKEVIENGSKRTVVEFNDALVVKSLVEDGRTVGKTEFYAQVIRFNSEEDLALLRLRKKNFVEDSVQFYLDSEIPPIGTKLLHVGSLLGQLGSNSMTDGIMSQHGRLVENKIFDQTTCAAFPGSSGGGVYTESGEVVGLVLRGAGETFNLIVPVRRLYAWAIHADVAWAVDDTVPVPTEAELESLPIEDNGTAFGGHAPSSTPEAPAASSASDEFKYLLRPLRDRE